MSSCPPANPCSRWPKEIGFYCSWNLWLSSWTHQMTWRDHVSLSPTIKSSFRLFLPVSKTQVRLFYKYTSMQGSDCWRAFFLLSATGCYILHSYLMLKVLYAQCRNYLNVKVLECFELTILDTFMMYWHNGSPENSYLWYKFKLWVFKQLLWSTEVNSSQTETICSYRALQQACNKAKLTSIDCTTGLKWETETGWIHWQVKTACQHNVCEVTAYLKPLSETTAVIRHQL